MCNFLSFLWPSQIRVTEMGISRARFFRTLNTRLDYLEAFHLVDGFCRLWRFFVPTWPWWRDVQLCPMGFRAAGWETCMLCSTEPNGGEPPCWEDMGGRLPGVLAPGLSPHHPIKLSPRLGDTGQQQRGWEGSGVAKGCQHNPTICEGSRASLTTAQE